MSKLEFITWVVFFFFVYVFVSVYCTFGGILFLFQDTTFNGFGTASEGALRVINLTYKEGLDYKQSVTFY